MNTGTSRERALLPAADHPGPGLPYIWSVHAGWYTCVELASPLSANRREREGETGKSWWDNPVNLVCLTFANVFLELNGEINLSNHACIWRIYPKSWHLSHHNRGGDWRSWSRYLTPNITSSWSWYHYWNWRGSPWSRRRTPGMRTRLWWHYMVSCICALKMSFWYTKFACHVSICHQTYQCMPMYSFLRLSKLVEGIYFYSIPTLSDLPWHIHEFFLLVWALTKDECSECSLSNRFTLLLLSFQIKASVSFRLPVVSQCFRRVETRNRLLIVALSLPESLLACACVRACVYFTSPLYLLAETGDNA